MFKVLNNDQGIFFIGLVHAPLYACMYEKEKEKEKENPNLVAIYDYHRIGIDQ